MSKKQKAVLDQIVNQIYYIYNIYFLRPIDYSDIPRPKKYQSLLIITKKTINIQKIIKDNNTIKNLIPKKSKYINITYYYIRNLTRKRNLK